MGRGAGRRRCHVDHVCSGPRRSALDLKKSSQRDATWQTTPARQDGPTHRFPGIGPGLGNAAGEARWPRSVAVVIRVNPGQNLGNRQVFPAVFTSRPIFPKEENGEGPTAGQAAPAGPEGSVNV